MKALPKKILRMLFIGNDGKLSFTALFAGFAFVVMVTLYIKGLIQGHAVSAHWLDWSILIVEVAVLGRVGQKVLMEGVSAIATIRKPKAAPGIAAATPHPPKAERSTSVKPSPPKAEAPKTSLKKEASPGNFSIEEFNSKDGAPMPPHIKRNIRKLIQNLEIIREACGNRAITITSGYRSAAHNAAVGGEPNSLHMKGMAADIQIKGMKPQRVYAIVNELMDAGTIAQGGLGIYEGWVHYDIRGTRARWKG